MPATPPPPSYATIAELRQLTGWSVFIISTRCRAARIPRKKYKNKHYYHREKALAVLPKGASTGTYNVPEGYLSLPEIAELAEYSKEGARAKLARANIPYKAIPRRGKPGTNNFGGRLMHIFPAREALAAILED